MLTFKALLFFIISLLFLIIQIIICYKFFSKREKGLLSTSIYYVLILASPSMLSSIALQSS